MQQACNCRLATSLISVFLLFAGCRSEQEVPVVAKAPQERSRFFTQVAGQAGPADLVNRLKSRFPDVEFTGGKAGPAGGGGWTQVELVVVIEGEYPPSFRSDLVPLLTELEQYCRTLAESNGVEILGKFEEQLKDGKKEGFKFDYQAQADSGSVRVNVLGRQILLTVSERE